MRLRVLSCPSSSGCRRGVVIPEPCELTESDFFSGNETPMEFVEFLEA